MQRKCQTKRAKGMKTEADWKYSPVLLYRPDIHPYDLPRMKPSFPTTGRNSEEQNKEYLVSTSTLRYWLIGKKTIYSLVIVCVVFAEISWKSVTIIH